MSDADRFDVQPNVANHFAWIRTSIALQRTLLAGVRTAVSLIGFGFTVAQFFSKMQSNVPEGLNVVNPAIPRNLGLTLIVAGVASLAIFTWQYHAAMRTLRSGAYAALATEKRMNQGSYLVAFVVMLIGVAAFGSVFLHF